MNWKISRYSPSRKIREEYSRQKPQLKDKKIYRRKIASSV